MIRDGIRDAAKMLWTLDASVMDAALRSLWVSALAVGFAACLGLVISLLLARRRFIGCGLVVLLFRVGMSVPTVLIGLVLYAVLSRRGPLGSFELLFTVWAVLLGELCLALPIVTSLSHAALVRLDRRVAETAWMLGAGPVRRAMTYLREVQLAIGLAVLTAFSRCFTELGIAMMVGGNIAGRTRTLTTATALERSRGDFARGVAMGLILLVVALLVTLVISWFSRNQHESEA